MPQRLTRTLYSTAAALLFGMIGHFTAGAATVTSVVDTGLYNANEMAIDRSNGDIYLATFRRHFTCFARQSLRCATMTRKPGIDSAIFQVRFISNID